MTPIDPKPDRAYLMATVQALPSLPAVVVELNALMQREDVSLDQVSSLLSCDQALAAKVLHLANSPFYGVSGRIASIRDGLNILGLRQVGTLVMAAALTVEFERLHGKALKLDEYWGHSIACAVAARAIAQAVGLDEAAAFTAGLLHDVGRLVLASVYPQEVAQAIAAAREEDIPPSLVEQRMLGVCHTEVGDWLARHWRFGSLIEQAILLHHVPPPSREPTLADVIHVADAVAHALDLTATENESVPLIDHASWTRLSLRPAVLQGMLERIEQEFNELRPLLWPPKGGA